MAFSRATSYASGGNAGFRGASSASAPMLPNRSARSHACCAGVATGAAAAISPARWTASAGSAGRRRLVDPLLPSATRTTLPEGQPTVADRRVGGVSRTHQQQADTGAGVALTLSDGSATFAVKRAPNSTLEGCEMKSIIGRWIVAFALVPVGLLVLLPTHGHVTGGLLIALIAVMVAVALVRAARRLQGGASYSADCQQPDRATGR